MPICATAIQQPDGRLFLALDPTVSEVSTCSYVVQSGAEVGGSILSLSIEDGSLVSAGIVSCWAAAWALKSIIHIVKGSST